MPRFSTPLFLGAWAQLTAFADEAPKRTGTTHYVRWPSAYGSLLMQGGLPRRGRGVLSRPKAPSAALGGVSPYRGGKLAELSLLLSSPIVSRPP